MGKRKAQRRLADNEAMAVSLNIRTGGQRLNEVAETIRGKPVETAIATLRFSRRRVAAEALKTLRSAIANAENNHNLDPDRLYVAHAYVGKGIVMKRWRPASKGRAAPILKPFSRLTVIVRER